MSSTSEPQTLADLRTYVGNLINDPNNTRYSTTIIDSMLNIAQSRWNKEATICRFTQTLTVVAGTSLYALSTLTVTPIKFLRVTHKGIDLHQKSKNYFDMFASYDWTTDTGTPFDYYLDVNAASPVLGLRPVPQAADAGAFLQVEYHCVHTAMSNTTDTPFIVNGVQNALVLPYAYGLGLEVAAQILEPDPTPETVQKAKLFRSQSEAVLSQVIQIYSDLETETPMKMLGGRNWVY